MMSFQIVSDLHIEYKNNDVPNPLSLITPSADILILAGDIGSFYKYDQLKSFLSKLCEYFKIVLYVCGNHEYYTVEEYKFMSMTELLKKFREMEKCIPNMYILNRNSVQINDICIIGCTLWSDAKVNIPSFIVKIKDMSNLIYKRKYEEDLSYIKKMIAYCEEKNLKLVVVTHYCPTYLTIFNTRCIKKIKDKYISLYTSELDYLLTKNKVHTWICGHIHMNFDFLTEGGTRVVGNQKGKPKDNILDYDKSKTIEV